MCSPCRAPSPIAVWLATLGAILLANLFFWGHGHPFTGDARGYYELSRVIRHYGLFHFCDDQHILDPGFEILFPSRTYGYPLFIALCSLLTSHNALTVQIAVFNGQLLLCLVTCYVCAIALQEIFKARGFGTWLYVCSALNPYVLIQATELLTEALGAVLTYLVFVLTLKAGLDRIQDDNLFAQRSTSSCGAVRVFLTCLLAGFSVMVRPASVAIVFAFIVLWALRAFVAKRLSLQLSLLMALGLFLPCVPQLVNNYRFFHQVHPIVVDSPLGPEMELGCRFIKYATIEGTENPQLFYPNPFARPGLVKPLDFLRTRPLLYGLTLGLHTFAVLDHDFPFTYVRDLHPWYRWPLSLVNYVFLAGTVYGMFLGLRRFFRRRYLDAIAFAALTAALMSGLYLGLYAPCEPESRYSLPLFLMWSPFFIFGIFKVKQVLAYRCYLMAAKIGVVLVLFLGGCVYLSALVQAQPPRLHAKRGSTPTFHVFTGLGITQESIRLGRRAKMRLPCTFSSICRPSRFRPWNRLRLLRPMSRICSARCWTSSGNSWRSCGPLSAPMMEGPAGVRFSNAGAKTSPTCRRPAGRPCRFWSAPTAS
jgi:hypothetical protein